MSVYFDRYIDDQQLGVLKVGLEWHRVAPLLAVSWYSEQQGGGVSVYNDEVSWREMHNAVSVPCCGSVITGGDYFRRPTCLYTLKRCHSHRSDGGVL